MSCVSGRDLFRGLFASVLLAGLLVAGIATNAAADGWPVVIRPGVNAGNGTTDLNISFLAPLYQTDTTMVFLTPNFRYNDGSDENEVNAGVGVRKLMGSGNWYLGGNFFYDEIRSRYSHNYHQIGAGIEARSKWFDVMLNGHLPVSDTEEGVDVKDYTKINNHFMLVHSDGLEEQLSGVDGEVGFLIPGVSDYVETRLYVGGYHWVSQLVGDFGGVKARVEVTPMPILTMNATYDYDDYYESTWRGEAYLNVPFDMSGMFSGKNPFAGIGDALKFGQGARDIRDRMTDRVERDRYIILVEGNSRPEVVGFED